jgi:hypothetical protein
MSSFTTKAMFLVVVGLCFACGGGETQNDVNDTGNPCALKGDRPNWCDDDVSPDTGTDEDATAPPGCGDGTCANDEYCDTCPEDCGKCWTCGDGVCTSWDEAGRFGYWEDCDYCPEDCGCEFGFSCVEDGVYADSEYTQFVCKDDPFYELKLVIPGKYVRPNGYPVTAELLNNPQDFGCAGIVVQMGGFAACFELPLNVSCCKNGPTSGPECQNYGTAGGNVWFNCAILGEQGSELKAWCDSLDATFKCTGGVEQCGPAGVRIEQCEPTWTPNCTETGYGVANLKVANAD